MSSDDSHLRDRDELITRTCGVRLSPGDFRTEFLEVRFFKSSIWCLVLVCYVLSFFQNYEFGYIILAILDNDVEQDMDNGHPN